MKRVRDILLAVVAVMVAVACGESRHISNTHKQAEAVMQEYPDSALTLLQAINPDELTTDRGRAMHALLLSQAYDKNYIDLTDDSLISIAVDYFAPTNEHHYAMLAHYYHGRVLQNAKAYIEAMLAYEQAKGHIDYVDDYKLKGLLFSQVGEMFFYNMDYPKSIESYKTAYDFYDKGGFIAHRNFALYDLGEAYFGNADYFNSEKYLNQALKNAIDANDRVLAEVSKKALLAVYVQTKRTDKAFDLFKELSLNVANVAESSSYLGIVAVMYAQMRNSEMSDRYMKKAWEISSNSNDSITLFYRAASCNYFLGHINSAWQNNLKGYNLQSTLLRQTLQQPLVTIQRDYLDQKNKVIVAEKKLQQIYTIIVLGIIISLIVGLFIYVQNKRKKDNAKYARLQKMLEWQNLNSREQFNKNKEAILYLEKQLVQTVDKNSNLKIELKQKTVELAEANKLIQQQLHLKELAETNIRSSEIYKMIGDYISQSKAITNLKDWYRIFDLIDSFYPHFRDTLYSLCRISEIEIKVCVLIKIGFTPTEIAILTSSSKSNISSIRSRLYTKIFKKTGVSKDLDDFILSL